MGNNKLEVTLNVNFLFFFPSAGQFGSRFKALLALRTDLVIIGKRREEERISTYLQRRMV